MWLFFIWVKKLPVFTEHKFLQPFTGIHLESGESSLQVHKAFLKISVTMYLIFACFVGSCLDIFKGKCLKLSSVPLMSVKHSVHSIIFNLVSSVVLYKEHNLWSCSTLLFPIMLLLPLSINSLLTSTLRCSIPNLFIQDNTPIFAPTCR